MQDTEKRAWKIRDLVPTRVVVLVVVLFLLLLGLALGLDSAEDRETVLGLGSWVAPAGLGLIGVMEGVVRWKTGGLLVQQSPPNEDPSNP